MEVAADKKDFPRNLVQLSDAYLLNLLPAAKIQLRIRWSFGSSLIKAQNFKASRIHHFHKRISQFTPKPTILLFLVNLCDLQAKSDKESLVEAAAKQEEEENEEEDVEEVDNQAEAGSGKKPLKKTKSSLRFGCIPKKPPKEKVIHLFLIHLFNSCCWLCDT